jgi:hypothetical protein
VYVISDTPQHHIVDALIFRNFLNCGNMREFFPPGASTWCKVLSIAKSRLKQVHCAQLVYLFMHILRRATLRSAPASDGSMFVQLIDLGDAEIISVSKICPVDSSGDKTCLVVHCLQTVDSVLYPVRYLPCHVAAVVGSHVWQPPSK